MPMASAMPYKTIKADGLISAGWSGAYWGASAGGGATRSDVISAERGVQSSSGFINGFDALDTASADNGYGGLVHLFAGWNFQVSRSIVGAQIEATSSDLD